MSKQAIKPAWLTYPDAAIYTGLSRRTLERRVADGTLIASYVKPKGAHRGRRLISRESIDRWIEDGIGQSHEMPVGVAAWASARLRLPCHPLH